MRSRTHTITWCDSDRHGRVYAPSPLPKEHSRVYSLGLLAVIDLGFEFEISCQYNTGSILFLPNTIRDQEVRVLRAEEYEHVYHMWEMQTYDFVFQLHQNDRL